MDRTWLKIVCVVIALQLLLLWGASSEQSWRRRRTETANRYTKESLEKIQSFEKQLSDDPSGTVTKSDLIALSQIVGLRAEEVTNRMELQNYYAMNHLAQTSTAALSFLTSAFLLVGLADSVLLRFRKRKGTQPPQPGRGE